jgi:polyisoprenoid-binding protein YceI
LLLAVLVLMAAGLAACGPSSGGLTPLPSATPRPTSATASLPTRPTGATLAPRPTLGPVLPPAGPVRLVVAPGTAARYVVREQLAGVGLPNDAVGETQEVRGQVVLTSEGALQRDESRFTVDLASLKSDDSRRDNYVRRNTLNTAQFPTAEFVLRDLRGLPLPMPGSGEARFQMVGDLTVRGVTQSVVWDVEAAFSGEGVAGKAATRFPFSRFQLQVPSVFVVVSVEDNIRLELDFRLVRSG